jgi:hypothetical protein
VLAKSILGWSFYWQIEMRRYKLQEGLHHAPLETTCVRDAMSEADSGRENYNGERPRLAPADHLKTAFELMDQFKTNIIPVTKSEHKNQIMGIVLRSDSLAVSNGALIQNHIERHQ